MRGWLEGAVMLRHGINFAVVDPRKMLVHYTTTPNFLVFSLIQALPLPLPIVIYINPRNTLVYMTGYSIFRDGSYPMRFSLPLIFSSTWDVTSIFAIKLFDYGNFGILISRGMHTPDALLESILCCNPSIICSNMSEFKIFTITNSWRTSGKVSLS